MHISFTRCDSQQWFKGRCPNNSVSKTLQQESYLSLLSCSHLWCCWAILRCNVLMKADLWLHTKQKLCHCLHVVMNLFQLCILYVSSIAHTQNPSLSGEANSPDCYVQGCFHTWTLSDLKTNSHMWTPHSEPFKTHRTETNSGHGLITVRFTTTLWIQNVLGLLCLFALHFIFILTLTPVQSNLKYAIYHE